MQVTISTYPDDSRDPYFASRFHTDDLSVVFVDTAAGYTDGDGTSAWAQSILTALGKQIDLPGSRTHSSDDLNSVPVWLHAHRTRWVVLPDAHLIKVGARGRFLSAIAAGGADLLLIARPHRLDQTIDAFIGWDPATVDWCALDDLLQTTEGTVGQRPTGRLPLPAADWPTFRWDARQTMNDEQFARFDLIYLAAYRATCRDLGPEGLRITRSRGQTRRLLERVTDSMSTIDDMVIALRAVQAAHFARGYNLRIQSRTMMARLSGAADTRLQDDDWNALRTYQDPLRAAACALRACGMPVREFEEMTIDRARGLLDATDAPASADAVRAESTRSSRWAEGADLDPRARPFVEAAVLHRLLEGAHDHEQLVPHTIAWITRCLNRAWADTGVSIGVAAGAGRHVHVGAWQYHDGFVIQGILG